MIELKALTSLRRALFGVAAEPRTRGRRSAAFRLFAGAMLPLLFALAGCGSGNSTTSATNSAFTISPGTVSIDTNCVGCNSKNSAGSAVLQFTATSTSGGAAAVTWTTSAGGDSNSGRGSINSSGQYSPPAYLTANSVQVTVTAALASNPSMTASAVVTITPGFLQPLTPENAALGANGTLILSGFLAEAGGSTAINWDLSNTANGSGGGQGTLGTPSCVRSVSLFTHCTVTYTAPATVTTTNNTYVVATVGTSSSKTSSAILLNAAGVSSSPVVHQQQQASAAFLGTSGGNNNHYDQTNGQITDCCGGTLGSLIRNSGGTQYILSNNHVLARSDQAAVGETIVQPALIDDNCDPFGHTGAAISAVGTLTGFLSLKSATTNADAAIASVNSGAVNASGAILELGSMQGGSLAAAPPGISCTVVSAGNTCTAGKGENAALNMVVAKSGRTTGLTCASISAISLNVNVDYYTDCAETNHYLTKTYTNQIAIRGNQFIDAGDSGALVVDTANAEPVGLFFSGGVDSSGVSIGVASPAQDVLSELGTMSGTNYTFVGAADHAVSCLNYGNGTAAAAQAVAMSAAQAARAEQAMGQARMLVNPSTGILSIASGKSSDHSGEAAVIVYVDQNMNVNVPSTVNGVRTVVIPTTARELAFGIAPLTPQDANETATLTAPVLRDAVAAKNLVADDLMQQNEAFFGVGVGQSLDNPREAVLVIFVDRKRVPAQLPATMNGMRTHYIVMDRLHVTQSYATPIQSRSRCMPHAAPSPADIGLVDSLRSRSLGLQF